MCARSVNRLREAIGAVLRQAREDRDLTLRDVQARSMGRFKPSSLGGYERGEREISVHRFCELAAVYQIPPDRLLASVLDRVAPEGRAEVVAGRYASGRRFPRASPGSRGSRPSP